jgi:NAD(P)H-nitrite reductase large subunit
MASRQASGTAGHLGPAVPVIPTAMRDAVRDKGKMVDTEATLTCRCEEILLQEIVAALAAGAQTVDDVKRRTRAGMGVCQGIFCVPVIAAMVAQATGVPIDRVAGMTMRQPVRPSALETLAALNGLESNGDGSQTSDEE